jgi:neutral ceramidase
MSTFYAGAAQREITPVDSQFLFGYPHVERYSTGVHDPLYSSALYLETGGQRYLIIANDIIFVSQDSVAKVRPQISKATGIPASNIMITATHTHSGPSTMDYICNEADDIVPGADPAYIELMESRIIEAGIAAAGDREESVIGFYYADGTGVGTNRRDPAGPSDLEVPVVVVKRTGSDSIHALMLVCSMHPTVMHEDSKLISGDFPGMTREYLQKALGKECVILYNTGCEGNQSPRHVTKGNTFDEARRIGYLLGKAVERNLDQAKFLDEIDISFSGTKAELIRKPFPGIEEASGKLSQAVKHLDELRTSGAPSQEVRTAECDWFGAEETLTLAMAQVDGRIEAEYAKCMPAEIDVLRIGSMAFVFWPGEVFIEYQLDVRSQYKNAYIINLANGELQGYIVTREAAEEGGYEASNGLFAPESGDLLVGETRKLLAAMNIS